MDNDKFKIDNHPEYNGLSEEARQKIEEAYKKYEQEALLPGKQLTELNNMREALLKWKNSPLQQEYEEEYETLRKAYDEKWGNE